MSNSKECDWDGKTSVRKVLLFASCGVMKNRTLQKEEWRSGVLYNNLGPLPPSGTTYLHPCNSKYDHLSLAVSLQYVRRVL